MSGFPADEAPADRHCDTAGSDAAEDVEATQDLPESPVSPPLWLSEDEQTQAEDGEEAAVCGQ